jgi:hypothetical protein
MCVCGFKQDCQRYHCIIAKALTFGGPLGQSLNHT